MLMIFKGEYNNQLVKTQHTESKPQVNLRDHIAYNWYLNFGHRVYHHHHLNFVSDLCLNVVNEQFIKLVLDLF